MNYIKILLLLYLVLRIVNVVPSNNITLTNSLQNVILALLLVLLAAHDPIVCLLVVIAILLNTKNEYTEQLFTNIKKEDLENLTKTLATQKPVVNEIVEKKKPKVEDKPKDCIPEFIISKDMLLNAQNNIVDKNNLKKFPNEIKEKDVNIQGIYEDITGFNI